MCKNSNCPKTARTSDKRNGRPPIRTALLIIAPPAPPRILYSNVVLCPLPVYTTVLCPLALQNLLPTLPRVSPAHNLLPALSRSRRPRARRIASSLPRRKHGPAPRGTSGVRRGPQTPPRPSLRAELGQFRRKRLRLVGMGVDGPHLV